MTDLDLSDDFDSFKSPLGLMTSERMNSKKTKWDRCSCTFYLMTGMEHTLRDSAGHM